MINLQDYLKSQLNEHIKDKVFINEINEYFDKYLKLKSDLKNTDFINILEDKFNEHPRSTTEFKRILNNTKYLISIDTLLVESFIDSIINVNSELNDIMLKLHLEQVQNAYQNGSLTNYVIFESLFNILNTPHLQQTKKLKSILEDMNHFYIENEENILIWRLLNEGRNAIDNFSISAVKSDLVNFILSEKKNRQEISKILSNYKHSQNISEALKIINHFSEKSFKLNETTSQFVNNFYSFTSDLIGDEFLFATKDNLYSINLNKQIIEQINAPDIIKMNENIFKLNSLIDENSPTTFTFRLGNADLVLEHDEDTLSTIYKYDNRIITEKEFPVWLSKFSNFVRSNDFSTIWTLYENLKNYRKLDFVTKIKNETTGLYNDVNIFNINENFAIEVNSPSGSCFENNLSMISLCNTVFEHTGLDISQSVDTLLSKEKGLLNELEKRIDENTKELDILKTQFDKVDLKLNNNEIQDLYLNEISELRDNLALKIDDKMKEISKLKLEFDIRSTESVDVSDNKNNRRYSPVNKKTVATIARQEYPREEFPNAKRNEFVSKYALKKLPGTDEDKVERMYKIKSRDKVKDITTGEYGIVDWIRSTGNGTICVMFSNGRQKFYSFKQIGKDFKVLKSNFNIYKDKNRLNENYGDVELDNKDSISDYPSPSLKTKIDKINNFVKTLEHKRGLELPQIGDYVFSISLGKIKTITNIDTNGIILSPKNKPHITQVINPKKWNDKNFIYLGHLTDEEIKSFGDDLLENKDIDNDEIFDENPDLKFKIGDEIYTKDGKVLTIINIDTTTEQITTDDGQVIDFVDILDNNNLDDDIDLIEIEDELMDKFEEEE